MSNAGRIAFVKNLVCRTDMQKLGMAEGILEQTQSQLLQWT